MWNQVVLISGGCFLIVMGVYRVWAGLAGWDFKGRAPVNPPLFVSGKLAMGLLWALALWHAAAGWWWAPRPGNWILEAVGAVAFLLGCALSLAALFFLGRETRYGLPQGECRLHTNGLYAWCRHPMYAGFSLISLGACLFHFNALTAACLVYALVVHHSVVLAEERFMARRFGSMWTDYADRVGRYGSFPCFRKAVRR